MTGGLDHPGSDQQFTWVHKYFTLQEWSLGNNCTHWAFCYYGNVYTHLGILFLASKWGVFNWVCHQKPGRKQPGPHLYGPCGRVPARFLNIIYLLVLGNLTPMLLEFFRIMQIQKSYTVMGSENWNTYFQRLLAAICNITSNKTYQQIILPCRI